MQLRKLQQEPDVLGLSQAPVDRHSPDTLRNSIELIRAAVQRQRTARRFVEETLNGLPVGVLVADGRQQVVLANHRLRVLLAQDEASLRGQTLPGLLSALQTRAPTTSRRDWPNWAKWARYCNSNARARAACSCSSR